MSNKPRIRKYKTIRKLSDILRGNLNDIDFLLLFAYNGVGKTRLSMEFKKRAKKKNNGTGNTLYFNAFTEDLFTWDNDIHWDADREFKTEPKYKLKLNTDSKFFNLLKQGQAIETKIHKFLDRYADFKFDFDRSVSDKIESVSFSRGDNNDIKISRGEESIFIWCLFLAIVQSVIDKAKEYEWVKYIYIDDPVSSLDDNNAIAIASDLIGLLCEEKEKNKKNKNKDKNKIIISSHHTLFFNVLCNELQNKKKNKMQYFLNYKKDSDMYFIQKTNDVPNFYHVAMLKNLKDASESKDLYTYHFNILRHILEKTAVFHGFNDFSDCIKQNNNENNDILHARLINLLSHGSYSLFDPVEMGDDNKKHFKNILGYFMDNYNFNPEIFSKKSKKEETKNNDK